MDQATPPQTTVTNGADLKVTKVNKLPKKIIFIVALVVLVIVGIILYIQKTKPVSQQSQPWNVNPKFAPTVQIATVGSEPIYGSDLNYKLYTNYPSSKTSPKEESEKLKPQLIASISTESSVLQAAKDQNIVNVPEEVLNSPDKNHAKRYELIKEIRQKIQSDSSSNNYSVITIWFYNMFKPSVTLDQAKSIAFSRITGIHNRLKNNSINMSEAGNLIKNDKQLANLDKNYQGNAYATSNVAANQPISKFSELNEAAYKLKEGEISSIIKVVKKGREIADNAPIPYTKEGDLDVNEQFYAIVKLEDSKSGKYPGLTQWTKEAIAKYTLSN